MLTNQREKSELTEGVSVVYGDAKGRDLRVASLGASQMPDADGAVVRRGCNEPVADTDSEVGDLRVVASAGLQQEPSLSRPYLYETVVAACCKACPRPVPHDTVDRSLVAAQSPHVADFIKQKQRLGLVPPAAPCLK